MEIRNTGTEKECEICGAWFAQTNPTQKYCPECRKDSWNLKRDMDRNIRRSIREYGTGRKIEPIRNVCKFCGKEFETWKYEKDYCSQECRTEAKIAATRCQNCGKSMTELGIHEKVTGAWFCSDNCRKEWKWTVARKEGAVKICPVCGKEFLGRKYCSRGRGRFFSSIRYFLSISMSKLLV